MSINETLVGKLMFSRCIHVQALGPYSVSKTALLGLTRALAPELAHSNIRVNCVAPGVIKTRFSNAVTRKIFSFPFKFIHCMTALLYLHLISLQQLSCGRMKASWMSLKSSSPLKGRFFPS